MKYLIYLHGFNSSPQSEKAQLTVNYFQAHASDKRQEIKVLVPALPPAPLEAISLVHALIKKHGQENLLGFMGSSLGGFYSLFLQTFYSQGNDSLKAILINPAVRPFDLLTAYLGENQNMYTGERYQVEASHMEDLKSLVVEPSCHSNNTMLLTQTHDEVLNYQEAVSHLQGAKLWIQYGGSHAFDHYESVLPCMFGFFFKN